MPETNTTAGHAGDIVGKFARQSRETYGVPRRGRPELTAEQAALKILRRQEFGNYMGRLRNMRDLSVNKAAELAGIVPPRKLAHYESTCYPPGDAINKLSVIYDIEAAEMALQMLRCSEPDLYQALTGEPGYTPENDEVKAEILRQGTLGSRKKAKN